MIDDQRKFIYVENPKTATTSLKMVFLGEEVLIGSRDPRIASVNHNTPAVIKMNYPEKWEKYLSFVVVRNTWDRARSFFYFYRGIDGCKSYQLMNFDEWVARDCPPPDESHLSAPMHAEGRFDDVLCQLRYVEGVDEVIVLRSYDPLERSKELQAGFDRICGMLNLKTELVPTFGNRNIAVNHRFAWNHETIEYLGFKYKEEIEKFNFSPPTIVN